MVRPDVSRPRSFRVDLTASVPPSGLFVADLAKAVESAELLGQRIVRNAATCMP